MTDKEQRSAERKRKLKHCGSCVWSNKVSDTLFCPVPKCVNPIDGGVDHIGSEDTEKQESVSLILIKKYKLS